MYIYTQHRVAQQHMCDDDDCIWRIYIYTPIYIYISERPWFSLGQKRGESSSHSALLERFARFCCVVRLNRALSQPVPYNAPSRPQCLPHQLPSLLRRVRSSSRGFRFVWFRRDKTRRASHEALLLSIHIQPTQQRPEHYRFLYQNVVVWWWLCLRFLDDFKTIYIYIYSLLVGLCVA